MSEQQQVRSAKEGSIYLISLCLILIVLLWIIWREVNYFVPLLLCLVFSYFLYRSISIDAFQVVYLVFRKYFKYKKVHLYFQNHKNSKIQKEDNQSPERLFQRIVIGAPETQKKKTLFVYNQRNHFEKPQSHYRAKNFQRQTKEEQYLKAREQYKKLIEELKTKGLDQKLFQEFFVVVKNSYIQKVKQLLKSSDENLKMITNTVQQNFEVKIINNQKILERLEPVSLDQVIALMNIIQKTRCFPFTPRMKRETNSAQLLNKLVHLANVRNKIDATLCDQFLITQKQRQQTVRKILEQLQQKKGGKQLLKVLLQLYNKNIEVQQYKIAWEEMNIIKGGLKVSESQIGGYMHVDLKLMREGNQKIYRAKPGEDNVWSFLSLAAQLFRLRL